MIPKTIHAMTVTTAKMPPAARKGRLMSVSRLKTSLMIAGTKKASTGNTTLGMISSAGREGEHHDEGGEDAYCTDRSGSTGFSSSPAQQQAHQADADRRGTGHDRSTTPLRAAFIARCCRW